jgi:ketosteroid isomerase-like protein
MRLRVLLPAFAVVFTLAVLTGCQPAVETDRSARQSSSPETVNTAAISAELMRIENDWPRVVREKDVAAVQRVEADDAMFVYPNGTLGNKAQDIQDMQTGALTADSWEVFDLRVNVLDADSAVVSGRSVVKNGKYKMPDGTSMDISGEYRFIDTFAKRNGEWKLVAGAGAKVMAPGPATLPSPSAKVSPAAAASPAAKASPAATASPARRASPAATATP